MSPPRRLIKGKTTQVAGKVFSVTSRMLWASCLGVTCPYYVPLVAPLWPVLGYSALGMSCSDPANGEPGGWRAVAGHCCVNCWRIVWRDGASGDDGGGDCVVFVWLSVPECSLLSFSGGWCSRYWLLWCWWLRIVSSWLSWVSVGQWLCQMFVY